MTAVSARRRVPCEKLGKLILLLSNEDLIELIKLKSDEGGPEDFLDEKIRKFIISLPR